MPGRIIRHRATPIVLVAGAMVYSIGIITYRVFVDENAGRIAGPVTLAAFVLAYYLICRNNECEESPRVLRAEIERLRKENQELRRAGLK